MLIWLQVVEMRHDDESCNYSLRISSQDKTVDLALRTTEEDEAYTIVEACLVPMKVVTVDKVSVVRETLRLRY